MINLIFPVATIRTKGIRTVNGVNATEPVLAVVYRHGHARISTPAIGWPASLIAWPTVNTPVRQRAVVLDVLRSSQRRTSAGQSARDDFGNRGHLAISIFPVSDESPSSRKKKTAPPPIAKSGEVVT